MFYGSLYVHPGRHTCLLVMRYNLSKIKGICSAKMLYVHAYFIDKFLKQKMGVCVEAVIAIGCISHYIS